MEADEFYELAIEPDFPSEMHFQLVAQDPDMTHSYSAEGLNGIADKMHAFMMARTFAFWKQNEKPPRAIRAYISLQLVDSEDRLMDDITQGALPFFDGWDIDGLSVLDGNRRIPRERGVPLDD